MDDLIQDKKLTVFGDSTYVSQTRQTRLEEADVFFGMIQRPVRGQKGLRPEQKAHNRLCAMFRAMVERPFAWSKRQGGFLKTRYRGLARNALDLGLGPAQSTFTEVYPFKCDFTAIVALVGRQNTMKNSEEPE